MSTAAPLKHFLENPSRSVANLNYRLRESWRRQTARVHPNPVFVFGNQKSGTSAIAALLGEATGLSYTIDILCLYEGLEERLLRGNVSFDEVLERGRYYFSKPIIKDPGFTFFYDEIASRFPASKRVFVLRDPRQNIRSILNRLKLPGNLDDLSNEQWQTLKQAFPGWYPILEGSLAGHQGSTYIETLALRCQKAFQLYQTHQTELIPIHYETFSQDKAHSIYNLASQLGINVTQSIDRVKDKQFQPKGNTDVPLRDFFGVDNLQRIEAICQSEMISMGYFPETL